MTEKFAYRASDDLTGALRDLKARIEQFYREVIAPWGVDNPDAVPVWYQGFESECLGFTARAGGSHIPAGLSANRNRDFLIPRRGASGDPWRGALECLNRRPKLGPVLRRFEVEPTIMVIGHGRIYHLGLHDTADCYYLTWGHEHPDPGPHLTAVPLSVYYAAVEAVDREGDPTI